MDVQDRQKYFEGRSAGEAETKVEQRDEAVSGHMCLGWTQLGIAAHPTLEQETAAILDESRASFRGWKPQLEDVRTRALFIRPAVISTDCGFSGLQLRLDKRTAEEAMLGLTSSVKARVDAKTTKGKVHICSTSLTPLRLTLPVSFIAFAR
jgi:hypothetical protein